MIAHLLCRHSSTSNNSSDHHRHKHTIRRQASNSILSSQLHTNNPPLNQATKGHHNLVQVCHP